MHRIFFRLWLCTSFVSTFSFPISKQNTFVSSSNPYTSYRYHKNRMSFTASATAPISILVECEIKADRIEDFLDVIEKDAVGSRLEPGCLRFDVLRDKENPCKFYFYEIYKDDEAVQIHKEQPHFALWTNFKASGGVISSMSHKAEGLFMDKF